LRGRYPGQTTATSQLPIQPAPRNVGRSSKCPETRSATAPRKQKQQKPYRNAAKKEDAEQKKAVPRALCVPVVLAAVAVGFEPSASRPKKVTLPAKSKCPMIRGTPYWAVVVGDNK
jgi:hypothetical protein